MNAMNRWIPAVFAALVGLSLSLPVAAQWKWRDKNGLTQYSDLPPPSSVPEQDILQRPSAATARRAPLAAAPGPAASAAPLMAARASDPELEARRKKVEQDALDKKKAEDAKNAAIRAENCSRAQEQMRTLDSGVRITRTNQSGEREFLDDAARAAETTKTQQAINSDCR
jgi:hypothetical protein